jgi:hypothetical protein
MPMQPLYDSWSLSISPIPPRSRLYALEPIGVGTALVESLSSYVARLAEAHSISVGDLVGHVLSELTDPKNPMITAAAKAVRIGGMASGPAAMRSTALQTDPRSGFAHWKPQPA